MADPKPKNRHYRKLFVVVGIVAMTCLLAVIVLWNSGEPTNQTVSATQALGLDTPKTLDNLTEDIERSTEPVLLPVKTLSPGSIANGPTKIEKTLLNNQQELRNKLVDQETLARTTNGQIKALAIQIQSINQAQQQNTKLIATVLERVKSKEKPKVKAKKKSRKPRIFKPPFVLVSLDRWNGKIYATVKITTANVADVIGLKQTKSGWRFDAFDRTNRTARFVDNKGHVATLRQVNQ